MSGTHSEVWARMTELFREFFEDESLAVGPGTTADDIEDWDSLSHIELMVEIERAFAVRLNTGEVAGLSNVGEMVELIAKRASADGPSNSTDGLPD